MLSFEGASIQCEKPSDKIYHFDGVIDFLSSEGEKKTVALNYENFILRGSSLRNTDWIYAVVVFTGIHF